MLTGGKGVRLDGELVDQSFRALLTGLPQLVFGCRGDGNRTWPSPQWEVYTGLPPDQSLGFGWLDAVHPDDRQLTLEAWSAASASDGYVVEHRIRRAQDGSYRWHQTRAAPLRDWLTPHVDWIGSSADIDDLYQLRQRIAAAERQLRVFVEGVPQLLWRSCEMGNWTWASPQWLSFTGQTQEQTHGRGWLDAVHPEDREHALAAWKAAIPTGSLDVEFRVHRVADGAFLWHRTRSVPVRNEAGQVVEWLGSTTDVQDLRALQEHQQVLLDDMHRHARELEDEVTERRRIEARLLYDAHHDGLTGLHNRAFFMSRLKAALQGMEHGASRPCAVLFLDLDRFKLVNDSLGHQVGDLLLMDVANRLRGCIGVQDTIARFGGDEFAVLLHDVDEIGPVLDLAERILASIRRPVWLGAHELFSSGSIGIVHARTERLVPEEVLGNADIAMYCAKRSESGYVVFTDAMRGEAVEALELRTDLRNALARNQLFLDYQPICKVSTGQTVGLEALLRWRHPSRGLVPPIVFIRIAEETGLIREIGRWVLREACSQMRRWRERYPGLDLYLNVNSSGQELKGSGFVNAVQEILSETGLDPRRLQLEVTESIFLQQPELIGEILDGIRAIGVRIALDDFGTGYSSLSYLDRFRVDTIKIDRSFVTGMSNRQAAVTIVETIVWLGHAMGLGVVAEGVENEAQLTALRGVGCTAVQGYFLGVPRSAQDTEAILSGAVRLDEPTTAPAG